MEFWKTIAVLCTVVCIGYCDNSRMEEAIATSMSDLMQVLTKEGPECLLSTGTLPECTNNLSLELTEESFDSDKLICTIILGKLPNLRTCILKTLKKCKSSTSSYIADLTGNNMLKAASCDESMMTHSASASNYLGSKMGSAFQILAPVLITLVLRR